MPAEQVSALNALGLSFALLMGVLLIVLPRRLALLPIALITCYMTFGQRAVIAGLDFTMLRLLLVFAFVRFIIRNEFRAFTWLRIDTLLVLWALSSIITYTLLWKTSDAFVNRLGIVYTALGLYFAFRFLLRDVEDLKRAARFFAVVLFPLMILMTVEKMTGRNPFSIFGGVPEFTDIRDGVLRCQGPFRHPILAGTFGAIWMPLFVGLWWQGKGNRLLAVVGVLSSTVITVLSGSSGPLATYLAGGFGLAMWQLRHHLRTIRWVGIASLFALHMVMNDSVWYLLARANIFSSSTGWHRANVIDKAITHFSDWWLIGARDPRSWGIHWGDITNQFLRVGLDGGLLTMALFIGIVALAFSAFGLSMRVVRKESTKTHRLLWAAGATLFAHVVTFFGVSYFDQNVVNWYFLLAASATMFSTYSRRMETAPTNQQVPATVMPLPELETRPTLVSASYSDHKYEASHC